MQPNKQNDKPLYLQLYEDIKQEILSGRLPADYKLFSIRENAKKLDLSNTTVEHAYQQLLIEGYVRSLPKSGYYVEKIDPVNPTEPSSLVLKDEDDVALNVGQRPDVFDMETYRKIVNNLLMHDESLYKPSPASGDAFFKAAIAQHLSTNRDVFTRPSHIVVAAGIQQLIFQLATVKPHQNSVAYLKPGFKRATHAFHLMGFDLFACDSIEEMLNTDAHYLYISPSNLYPSGDVLPVNERLTLIKYANDMDRIIIEDDYNHTFRYNAYQIPTIHHYAKGDRVIYIGSFSRTALVSQRLSYMVLPDKLLQRFDNHRFAPTISVLEQKAMAHFIKKGHYQKHLRRLSKTSKRVNDRLKSELNPYLNDERFTFSGLNSNMHIVVHCNQTDFQLTLIKRLRDNHLSYHTFEDMPAMVLIPYSGIDPNEFPALFTRLFAAKN